MILLRFQSWKGTRKNKKNNLCTIIGLENLLVKVLCVQHNFLMIIKWHNLFKMDSFKTSLDTWLKHSLKMTEVWNKKHHDLKNMSQDHCICLYCAFFFSRDSSLNLDFILFFLNVFKNQKEKIIKFTYLLILSLISIEWYAIFHWKMCNTKRGFFFFWKLQMNDMNFTINMK